MDLGQSLNLDFKDIKQEEILNSKMWKTINNGIDIGLRYLLPDLIENEIIELKDNLINYGLEDGIKKSIDNVMDTGKQAVGMMSGNFENIGQIQKIVKNGGIIDKISDALDTVINKAKDTGKINGTLSNVLKKGKTSILSSVEKNIESTLNDQITKAEYLDKYINNWKEYYNNKDFDGMQKEYHKIRNNLNDLIPIENTLKSARNIETIHNLIKNNGNDFNLTEEQLELASKL